MSTHLHWQDLHFLVDCTYGVKSDKAIVGLPEPPVQTAEIQTAEMVLLWVAEEVD